MKNVVLMCAEEDPGRCHRSVLITPDLINKGFEVRDIRSDGSYEVAEVQPKQLELPIDEITPSDTFAP